MAALSCILLVLIGIANCVIPLQGLEDDNKVTKNNIIMTVEADSTKDRITIKRNFNLKNSDQLGLKKQKIPTREELMNLTTPPRNKTHLFIPKITSDNKIEIQILKIKPTEAEEENSTKLDTNTSKLQTLSVVTEVKSKQTNIDESQDISEMREKFEVENSKVSRKDEDNIKSDFQEIGLGSEENKTDRSDFKNEKRESHVNLKENENRVKINSEENGMKNSHEKSESSMEGEKDNSRITVKNKITRNEIVSDENEKKNVSEESNVKRRNIDILNENNSGNNSVSQENEIKSNWKADMKNSSSGHKENIDGGNSEDEQEKYKGIPTIMKQNPVIIQTAVEAKPLEEILKKKNRISDKKNEEEDWKILKELNQFRANDTEIDVEFRNQRKAENTSKVIEPCKVFSFVLLERCPDLKKDPNAYNCRTVYVRNIRNECTYFVCAPAQNRNFGTGTHMEAKLMYCPPGTYFSPQLLVCDYIDNASHEVVCPAPEVAKNSTSIA